MKSIISCIILVFASSMSWASPTSKNVPDPIFKKDSIVNSSYNYQKSYLLPDLNKEVFKASEAITAMLISKPGGVSSGLQLWLKADAGVSSNINTNSGVWSDQSGQRRHANNSASNLSDDGSGTPEISKNTTSNLINYNPNLYFKNEQLKVGLNINPSAIGTMDIYVVVDGNNAILGNESGSDIDRSIAPNRVSNGIDIKDYFFSESNPKYNDQLKIFHFSYRATSNSSATSYVNINGKLLKTFTEQNSDNGYNDLYIGNAGNKGSFTGQIAEIIIYDDFLNTSNKSKVDTYLSLKYGISLDNSTTSDYVSSNGTVVFDASSNTGYTTGVFGLGRDDDSSLNQKISINGGSDLQVALQNNFSLANNSDSRGVDHSRNNQYLIISNNGLANSSSSDNVNTDTFETRFRRIWKVNLSGSFNQDVALKFDAFGGSVPANERYLLTDDDGDFSNGGTVNEGVLATNKTISGVRFTSARPYFTIAKISTLTDPGLSDFDNITKVYSDVDFTYDEPTTSSTGTVTYSSSNTAVATIESGTGVVSIIGVGETVITARQAATDSYKSGDITATLTVNKGNVTITAQNKSKTYDRNTFSGGYSVSGTGFRSGEGTGNLLGSGSFSGAALSATNAGSYTITPGGYSSNNYIIRYASGILTINKKALTITAQNKSKTYDRSAFSGGYSISSSGFISGEGLSSLSGALSITGAAASATNAGSYAITPGGYTSNNYSISYVNGTLTINKKSLVMSGITANDKQYDGNTTASLNTGALSYTGLIDPDVVSVTPTGSFDTAFEGNNKTVNLSYTLSGAQGGNYTASGQLNTTANILGNDNVLDFDGNGEYLQLPTGFYLQNNAYTVETWVNIKGSSFGRWARIFDFGNGAPDHNIYLSYSYMDTGKVIYGIHESTGAATTVIAPEALVLNQWNHIAITSSTTERKLYINGYLVATLEQTAVSNNVSRSNNYIGKSNWSADADANYMIDDFRIWSETRSLSQIQDNINQKLTGNESNLALFYSFDQGVPGGDNRAITQVLDQSGTTHSSMNTFTKTGSASNFVRNNRSPLKFDPSLSISGVTKTYGDDSFSLVKSSQSTATITYTTSDSEVATINSTTGSITITGVGTTTITATQTETSKYASATATASVYIAPKALSFTGITAADKTYDGTNVASTYINTLIFSGLVGSDQVLVNPTGTFNDANVGANKTVSLSFTYSGTERGNYTITTSQTSTTASITAKTVTATVTGSITKPYDGDALATLNSSNYILFGFVSGESATITQTVGAYDNKNIGTGKAVTTNIINAYSPASGTLLTNYSLAATATSTTGVITSKTITITGITAADKVYYGNTTATISTSSIDYEGLETGDNVSIASSTGVFDTKNVGTGKTVTLTNTYGGTDLGNYTIVDQTSTTASVTVRSVSVTPTTAQTKVYGSADPLPFTYNTETASGDRGLISGDAFTGTLSRTDGEAVGTYSITIGTLTNTNYSIDYSSKDFSITSKTITITGITAADKVYDGDATATISTASIDYDGLESGDNVSIASSSGLFDTKNIGTGKAVTLTNTYGGSDLGNYTIVDQTSTTASITTKTVTATVTGSITKPYDGDAVATLNSSNYSLFGFVSGESATITQTLGAYDNKNIGTGKAVTTNITNAYSPASGTLLSNYSLASTATSTTGVITSKTITITGITAVDKVYDGNTTATISTASINYDGLETGDNVSIASSSGLFDTKNVGTGKTVALTNTYSGTDLGNYTIVDQTSTTASITTKTVAATVTGSIAKVYDGDAVASLTSSNYSLFGFVSGESATITQTVGAYGNKNIGTGKAVSASLTNAYSPASGTLLTNYSLAATATSTTGVITSKTITITGITSADMVYDGNTTATISTGSIDYDGLETGDNVSIASSTGVFDTKNIGTGKTVTLTNTYGGTDLGNYTIVDQTSTTASVTVRSVSVTPTTAQTKVYGSADPLPFTYTTETALGDRGIVSGDAFTGTLSRTDGEAVGTYSITIGTLTNTNYSIDYSSKDFSITSKTITITGITAADKVYDGDATATISTASIDYDGLESGDNVSIASSSGLFDTKNIGTGKTVTLTNTYGGSDLGNYTIVDQITTTASITARTMTVTGFVAADKAYDASRTATVTFSSLTYTGRVFGDVVSVASAGGLFDTKAVGLNKSVAITATYTGSDRTNYSIQTQPSTTASITGKVAYLTGASGVNKVYDDNNSLPSGVSGYGLLTGVVAGDNVTANGIAAYDSKNAGSRTIVQGGVSLIGTDAANYSLNWTNGSGTISTRTLTVTARDDAKFVTQTDVVGFKGAAVVGFISDDSLAADLTGTLSIARTNAGIETAGTYTNVLSPSGYSAVNYTISYVPGNFTIVAADELLVTVSNTTMVYGNTPNYTILSGKYYSSTSSVVVTLTLPTYSEGRYTFNDGAGGTARFGLSLSPDTKSTANFYKVGAYSAAAIDIVETSANFSDRITVVGTLEVTPKSVAAIPSTVVKNYDGTTAMTGMSLTLSGTLSGDIVSTLGSGYFSNAQAGLGKTYYLSGLTLSGTDASNYVLTNAGTYSDTSGVINKIPLEIKANNATKLYDGNPYSGGNGVVYTGFISGESSAQLSGTLSYSGSSQGATAAGTYMIQPGGFTADNYSLSYVNGSLIIEAGDTDGDGILDINDNCPTVVNVDQADLDADGIGDVCDADIDGDGFTNTVEESCGTDPRDATSIPEDTDGDGIADCVDSDIDNDTILNVNDNCVYTPNTDQADLDGDRVGDVCDADMDGDGFTNTVEEDCGTDPRDFFDTPIDTDGDGLANCEDLDDDNDGQTDSDEEACGSDPLDASSLSPDYDSDGIPDCVDPDSDNDGCLNEVDAFPLDETECQDTDGDGTGNNTDTDDDNDGQTDVHENNCGSDPLDVTSMSPDYDTDGLPDCIDPDDDNDSQTDLDEEACGSDPMDENSLSPDFDSDGIPDCLDPDDDNDGCLDTQDAFPFDATECLDTDADGEGNNKDPDDDNDGQMDEHEMDCGSDPLNYASMSDDMDKDHMPDCMDPDIDGDGCLNYEDAFPYNPLECVDTDGDGIGDNEDPDDNNDGCEDTDLCISELITPNEIGIESVWLIQNITQYPNAYVRVFDRHRQLVFEQQGYKSDWDGKYQKSKKPLPAGPYYYIVQLNNGSAARTGWLYITY